MFVDVADSMSVSIGSPSYDLFCNLTNCFTYSNCCRHVSAIFIVICGQTYTYAACGADDDVRWHAEWSAVRLSDAVNGEVAMAGCWMSLLVAVQVE